MYQKYLNLKKNIQLPFSYQKCPFSAVRKGLRQGKTFRNPFFKATVSQIGNQRKVRRR